ncbi:MAG: hypothetical protein ABIV25_07305 [Paracoccaceae bacterium]
MRWTEFRKSLRIFGSRLSAGFRRKTSNHQQPQIVIEDDELLISLLPGTTNRLVLAFTGMDVVRGRRDRIEFAAVASAGGSHVLFINDVLRCWYSRPGQRGRIITFVTEFMQSHGIGELRSIGNSMGGYGAVLFCGYLPITHAAAFAPQLLMTPDVLAKPHWLQSRHRMEADLVQDLGPIMLQSRAAFTLVFGDRDADDIIHTANVPMAANIDLLMLPGCDHKAARWLKEIGALSKLAAAMLDGRRDEIEQFRQTLAPQDLPQAA